MSKNTKIGEELGLAKLEDLMSDDEEFLEPKNELIEFEDSDINTNILPSEDEEVLESEQTLIATVTTIEQEMLQHARDLMDLGHNVDVRAAGSIFTIAANLYTQAVNAQISRRDAALKKQKLLIDEAKLLKQKTSKDSPTIQVAVQNNIPEQKISFVGTIDQLIEAKKNETK